jgi:hypothetical protein
MRRITVGLAAFSAALVLLALPAGATAGGCEVLREPGDRAECLARAKARDVARAEVQREVDGATASSSSGAHSAAWTKAIEEADGVDVSEVVEPRLLAAIGGLAWFFLALRARRRRARTDTA